MLTFMNNFLSSLTVSSQLSSYRSDEFRWWRTRLKSTKSVNLFCNEFHTKIRLTWNRGYTFRYNNLQRKRSCKLNLSDEDLFRNYELTDRAETFNCVQQQALEYCSHLHDVDWLVQYNVVYNTKVFWLFSNNLAK